MTRLSGLHTLFLVVAVGFGSTASLLAQYGAAYMAPVAFVLFAVLLLAALVVFRRKV
jgi:hypothetical protein